MPIEKKTGWVDSAGIFHKNQEDALNAELRLAIKRLVKNLSNFENPEDESEAIDMLDFNAADFYAIYQERFAAISYEKDPQ